MNSNKKTARIVGILFLTAMVAIIVGLGGLMFGYLFQAPYLNYF